MLRIYDFECRRCGVKKEHIVAEDEKPFCEKCKIPLWKMPPKIKVNMGVGPYGYYDDNLGAYVHTNAERRKLCREQGVTPMGETPKPDGEAWV